MFFSATALYHLIIDVLELHQEQNVLPAQGKEKE